MNVVVRKIQRANPEVIAGLGSAGVATVHEAGAKSLLPPQIRALQRGRRLAGTAVTVSCGPGDNLMIHAAVEVIEPGDCLVVAPTSPADNGMFGELLAISVQAQGCVGLIIDGSVRDVAELGALGFPVWARAVHAAATTKVVPGSVNQKIECAGVAIRPGDVIVADDDGVVVVERGRAPEILAAAQARLEKEEHTRARLAAGELGLDLYGFRARLEDLGVRWVDSPEA